MAVLASMEDYDPPQTLYIISLLSIAVAGLSALWIAYDILARRGWRTMMWTMIPTYVITALYLWPITLPTYLHHGRPPSSTEDKSSREQVDEASALLHSEEGARQHEVQPAEHSEYSEYSEHSSSHRPMFATATIAACHSGVGCVLGNVVGSWLVYGTGARIGGSMLGAKVVVEFAFAMGFGVVFRYLLMAGMEGGYGFKTVGRACRADLLSLVAFEVGVLVWLVLFEMVIFEGRWGMDGIVYWFMMQIGMFLGHWLTFPVNWWLITSGIKEPCA